jgi:ribosomal protein S1
LVDIGITSFLPASHIGDGFVKNLDDYIGREMEFKIIEFNRINAEAHRSWFPEKNWRVKKEPNKERLSGPA